MSTKIFNVLYFMEIKKLLCFNQKTKIFKFYVQITLKNLTHVDDLNFFVSSYFQHFLHICF